MRMPMTMTMMMRMDGFADGGDEGNDNDDDDDGDAADGDGVDGDDGDAGVDGDDGDAGVDGVDGDDGVDGVVGVDGVGDIWEFNIRWKLRLVWPLPPSMTVSYESNQALAQLLTSILILHNMILYSHVNLFVFLFASLNC